MSDIDGLKDVTPQLVYPYNFCFLWSSMSYDRAWTWHSSPTRTMGFHLASGLEMVIRAKDIYNISKFPFCLT